MMDGLAIPFVEETEHVSVIRSATGSSMPHIVARVSAHTRAMAPILSCGLARAHRGNPAASIRVHSLVGIPVLFSGLASIPLLKADEAVLTHHHKVTLERLQCLYPAMPACFVHILSGTLPATVILHIKAFSLLFMIAILGPSNPLHAHGLFVLHNSITASWFHSLRLLASQYGLPDPLVTLTNPRTKLSMKSEARSKIRAFWHDKFVAEASTLPSLQYFRPSFIPPGQVHPLWTTCGSSSSAVRAATVQARLLSGRYRTDWLRRRWAPNESGACRLPGCGMSPGDTLHLLAGACPALASTQAKVISNWNDSLADFPALHKAVSTILAGPPNNLVAFLLDPSTTPAIIALTQQHGNTVTKTIFTLTRQWVWSTHRARLRLLGLHRYIM